MIYALFLCHTLLGGQVACHPDGVAFGPYPTRESCEIAKANLSPSLIAAFGPVDQAHYVCAKKPGWEID